MKRLRQTILDFNLVRETALQPVQFKRQGTFASFKYTRSLYEFNRAAGRLPRLLYWLACKLATRRHSLKAR